MKIQKSDIGKIYQVNEIMRDTPCQKCDSCIRMRILEMGLFEDEKIQIVDHSFGLWRINILTKNNTKLSTFALRDKEIDKICVF
jgi:Fe2+ transport system protein FeoA